MDYLAGNVQLVIAIFALILVFTSSLILVFTGSLILTHRSLFYSLN